MRDVTRREVLKGGLALGAATVLGTPTLSWGKSEKPIKIGMVDPLTGTYAALGGSEVKGAKLALHALNKKGGILGRPVSLLVEDTAANVGTAVQKAHKLVQQDKVDLLMGAVSSAVALAVSQAASQMGKVYMVTGGHTDSVTGSRCNWNTFRICSTTWMLAAGDAKTIADKFGKRWYFLTPDYAFGHTEHEGYSKLLKRMGGTELGNALAPLGTTDFSSYLIRVEQAKPDVLIVLQAGNDLVNALKQAVQFGLNKKMAIGGGLQELEVLAALPEAARFGWWTFEWWWNQPNVPHVKEFVAAYRKRYGSYPSARSWFGYAGLHSLALAANRAKSLNGPKVAHALEGMVLPPEVALEPHKPFFRKEDHQLMTDEFPGQVNHAGKYPNLFNVADVIAGDKIALPASQTQCKLTFPS
ncbi:MAG: ABC transporter substrate-binding protein [Deltaproteobacteria bacterium]|jgi:branched-chain amino acid transport system substrate-binding protein